MGLLITDVIEQANKEFDNLAKTNKFELNSKNYDAAKTFFVQGYVEGSVAEHLRVYNQLNNIPSCKEAFDLLFK